jgi:hypothetical protein
MPSKSAVELPANVKIDLTRLWRAGMPLKSLSIWLQVVHGFELATRDVWHALDRQGHPSRAAG